VFLINLQLFGGRGSSSSGAGGNNGAQQETEKIKVRLKKPNEEPEEPKKEQQPQQQAQQQPTQPQQRNYHEATPQEESAILNQQYDVNTRAALTQYARMDMQANGKSQSQNLNHALEVAAANGTPLNQVLNATQQMMVTRMDAAMRPLGGDYILNRGAHIDFLQKIGLPSNYTSMSNAQISQALTGLQYVEDKYVSTAANIRNNPFLTGQQSGGREVEMSIKAHSGTKYVVGNKAQSEVVLGRGQQYKITGAHWVMQGRTIKTATPKGTYTPVPVLHIDVEVV